MTELEPSEVEIRTEADIVEARSAGREMAEALGFGLVDCTKIATAISELARNILLYAETGVVAIRVMKQPGSRVGIEVVATDAGPGMDDPELALRDGYSTSRSLGLGLPGTKRLMDEFELESSVGKGTTVRVGKWLPYR